MNNRDASIHFSSKRDDWSTPQTLFDVLDAEFDFTLDVAASIENAKCVRHFTIDDDGLDQDWGTESCWMNPPYGAGVIDRWIDKAIAATARGATVVALVPNRPSSRWYTACLQFADEARFIEGRLSFGDGTAPAPFPSCVFVFRPSPLLTWAAQDRTAFVLRRNRKGGPRWMTIQLRPRIGGSI
jgi:site-specific DNA-methyltransferase (adenine-specific)